MDSTSWGALIYVLLFFNVLMPLVFLGIFIPAFRNRKISKGINNSDAFSQHYLFRVCGSKDDFLRRIGTPNTYDTVANSFDSTTMTITFFHNNVYSPYLVSVKEFDENCYVRLSVTGQRFDSGRSNIPLLINEFMIKKFDAELLEYGGSTIIFD